MKVGKNAPCPCGSGKKHKKCCLPAEMEWEPDSTEESWALPEDMDEALVMNDLITSAMAALRRNTLGRKPHIKAYTKIRNLHSGIVDAMAQYHDDGKFHL